MAQRELLSKFVGVKMSADLTAKIDRIARIESNTPSSVIRRLLVSAIEREDRERRAAQR